MNKKTALIVEDEPKIADLLSVYLENDGFETHQLYQGDQVLPFVRNTAVHVILLDILLPGRSGVEICREIRTFSKVPIIFITAKVDEVDRVSGLNIGADDYICKPFSPREVVARVNAVLRRVAPDVPGHIRRAGPVTIDEQTRNVLIGDTAVELTKNEYELLLTLISAPEKVFSRTELVVRVQGYHYEGYERAIDSHIKNLRKKIATVLPDNRLIQTVYGVGYRFTPQ